MYEKNALNNFKDVLGKYCAINQFVELSKRCFLVEHQNEIQKRDTFVKLATEYAVKRGTNRINFKVLFEEITICIV